MTQDPGGRRGRANIGAMAGTLYVVATPLGNLEDLSPRAARVLREAALVACEDTRRTGRLLAAHAIATPTTSCFEHNERHKVERLLTLLREGKDVALCSDAGTPGISDPGYRVVRAAREAGLPVVPIPGPSAVIAALSVSGLPTDRFLFVGFLPARAKPRRESLVELRARRETLVFYESPLRLRETLADLRETFGEREAFLCREATKMHEEYRLATLSALLVEVEARGELRGEVVLCVAGADPDAAVAAEREAGEPPEELYARLVAEGRTRREAVKEVARRLGLPARAVYDRVLAAEAPVLPPDPETP